MDRLVTIEVLERNMGSDVSQSTHKSSLDTGAGCNYPSLNRVKDESFQGNTVSADISPIHRALQANRIVDIEEAMIFPCGAHYNLSIQVVINGLDEIIALNAVSGSAALGLLLLDVLESVTVRETTRCPDLMRSWYARTVDFIEYDKSVLVLP